MPAAPSRYQIVQRREHAPLALRLVAVGRDLAAVACGLAWQWAGIRAAPGLGRRDGAHAQCASGSWRTSKPA